MKNLEQILLVLAFGISLNGFAQEKEHQNLKNNLALDGYDLVTYFRLDIPQKGKKQFSASYQNAIYYFQNAENKIAFENNPEQFRVAYGGWCAYAMGESGEKVSVNPLTYKLIDGKLFLFYNKLLTNTLKKWNENEKEFHRQADKNWAELIKTDK